MSDAILKGYNAVEFSFANKLPNGTKIKLGNKYSYNVKYIPGNKCIGEMDIHVYDTGHEDLFYVKLIMRGIFDYKPDSEKENIHVESFKTLFPYARAFITTMTANAGLPPLIIPEADIDNQNIYRFDLGGTHD